MFVGGLPKLGLLRWRRATALGDRYISVKNVRNEKNEKESDV